MIFQAEEKVLKKIRKNWKKARNSHEEQKKINIPEKILKERLEKREKHGNSGKRVPKKAKEKKKNEKFRKKSEFFWKNCGWGIDREVGMW